MIPEMILYKRRARLCGEAMVFSRLHKAIRSLSFVAQVVSSITFAVYRHCARTFFGAKHNIRNISCGAVSTFQIYKVNSNSNAKLKCKKKLLLEFKSQVSKAHNNLGKTEVCNLKNSIERYTDQKWSTLVCRKPIPGRDVKGTGASQELDKHGSIVLPGKKK